MLVVLDLNKHFHSTLYFHLFFYKKESAETTFQLQLTNRLFTVHTANLLGIQSVAEMCFNY